MKQNKLPENKLDIIAPEVGSGELYADRKRTAKLYPDVQELTGRLRGDASRAARDISLWLVTPLSPLRIRRATEIIAYYFRREFSYDFAPYHENENTDKRDRIFLLTREWDREVENAIGTIGFRWREYRNAPAQRVLAWVWIHPFLRHKGILTAYWKELRARYSDFYVEPPLSPAMKAFLRKIEHDTPDPSDSTDQ